MEQYYRSADGSDSGEGTGDSFYSFDASSANHNRRRLLSQQFSANAYLGHAFNACASTSPGSSCSAYVDVDPSLLRYTRPRLSSSSSSSGERLWQFLHLQSPLGSSSSPSPMGRACSPTRGPPTVYCTPAKAAVMDDVLVINGQLHEHNRLDSGSARRRLDLGSDHSDSTAYGGGIKFWGSNIRSGGGSGVFHPRPPDLCSYSPTFPSAGGSSSRGNKNRRGGGRGVFHPPLERRRSLEALRRAVEPSQQLGGQVNRNSSVPRAPPQEAETGPASGGTSAHGYAGGGAGMVPESAAVPDMWRRTKEEEERLFKILNGPIPPPPPPPPSASTFSWPPTEEEEAEIQRVLRGPGSGRRLPAFRNWCPED